MDAPGPENVTASGYNPASGSDPDTVASWSTPPAGTAGALEVYPWRDLSQSWHRRNNASMRSLMARILLGDPADSGPISVPVAQDPLRVWRRYSQAIFAGEVRPLLAMLDATGNINSTDIDWADLGNRVFDRLTPHLGPVTTTAGAVASATLTLFAYFESLVFWEHGMVYEQIRGLRAAVARQHRRLAEGRGDADIERWAEQVSRAAMMLAESLDAQFAVEEAIGCCCPVRLQVSSTASNIQLRSAAVELQDLWLEIDAADDDIPYLGVIRALVALMFDDISQTAPYYALLATEVAPSSLAFIDHYLNASPQPRMHLCDTLRNAVERCRSFETSPAGRRSVAATEMRAHRMALEEAWRCVKHHTPTLRIDEAEIVYVFPFGLPVASTGDDPVRRVLRSHLDGDPLLQVGFIPVISGVPWTLDDTPQTDAWLEGSDENGLDYVGVRLLPAEHELILQTSSGLLLRDLGLEVRFGGLGNHYVRIAVSTQTQMSDDGGRTWRASGGVWNPHTLDQFIRRGNADIGSETIWLQARGLTADHGTGIAVPDEASKSFISLAAAIVRQLVAYAETLSQTNPPSATEAETDPNPPVTDPMAADDEVIVGFLRRHAQVLVTIGRAAAISPDGVERVLEHAEELDGVLGSAVALIGQRPFAQSVLEWLRYPAPTDDERSRRLLHGRIRRELVWCGGDTSLIFAPSLPNWQLMETRELIEFAASLTGVYSRRHNWLLLSLAAADRETRISAGAIGRTHGPGGLHPNDESNNPAPLEELTTGEIRRELDQARRVELGLDECLNHVQVLLDRARNFRMSRDLQSRDIVHHICAHNGVVDLQDALGASIAAAGAQQRLVHARVERLNDALTLRVAEEQDVRRRQAQKPIQLLVGVLAVFSFIDLFWWFNDSWELNGNHWFWFTEFFLLMAVATIVSVTNLRIWRSDSNA